MGRDIDRGFNFRRLFVYFVLYVLFLGVFVGLGFFSYKVYKNWLAGRANDTTILLKNVSKLTDIPSDEVPTIATVTNAELIKQQSFFKDALVGDRVLLYKEAKKAILYRPSTGKIVSIAPLN